MSADFPDLIFPHELPYITSLSGGDLIYLERPNSDGTYTSYATSLSALITGGNGTSGYSGQSGASGYSGYSGQAGTSGYSGVAGASGYSGVAGQAGTSGYSGVAGASGYSGGTGADGASGYSGEAGASGYSGGTGADGASGYSGQAGASGYSGAQFTYSSDLVVSLSNGKTFGRFVNGDVIPATGKTPAEVIQMAIAEALAPTVSLTSSTTVAFNQTAISNVLNFSYTINSYGASVSTAVLEWRRNNTGTWTTLTNVTSATTYTHTITDTDYNTQPFNYRYTVVDTSNGTANATKDITPANYVAPSVSLTVAGTSIATPESNSTRERGNVSSNISGSVSRNSANVALTSYQLQYQSNGGSWVDIGTAVSIGPGTTSITPITHNESSLKTSSTIGYRVKVIDVYQTYLSSQVYSSTSTITFYYALFYGSSATAPTDSTAVRALPNKQFTTYSNPFTLNTGTTDTNFTVAIPATLSLSSVIDLDALNIDITSSYILSTFNVDDGGGTAISYKVYTLTTGVPYSPSHRHQVTRA